MPLIFVPFVWDGYYIPKAAALYAAVVALAFCTARRADLPNTREYFKSVPAAVFSVGYALLVIASALFAQDRKTAFFGSIFRIEGAITICAYAAMFVFASLCSSQLRGFICDKWFAISSCVAAAYGILQRHGAEILPIDARRALWRNQAFSTLGNPNFFGSFMCLCLPIAAVNYIMRGGKMRAAACAVLIYALLCSETQGAWIGGFAAFVIIAVYFLRGKEQIRKKRFLILAAVFAVLAAVYQLVFGTITAEIYSVFSDFCRLIGFFAGKTSYSAAAGGGRYRIFIWQYSLKLIAKFPWLGVGPDCMNIAIVKYFARPGVFRYDLLRVIDRAHNEYLNAAVSSGIAAAVLYTALIVRSIASGIKGIRQDGEIFGIFCAVCAYAVQAFFNISVVSVAPIFWIFLGVLAREK